MANREHLELEDHLAIWLVDTNREHCSATDILKYFPKNRQVTNREHLIKIMYSGERKGYWEVKQGRKKGSLVLVLA